MKGGLITPTRGTLRPLTSRSLRTSPKPSSTPTVSSPHPLRVRQCCCKKVPNLMKKLLVLSIPSSWSSTAKTDSRNKVVSTLTKCNHSTTTPAPQCQVSTRTLLPSSQKNTNQRVLATSPESTTPKFRSSQSLAPETTLSTCSRRTTTSSESNRVWVASRSPTKRLLSV